jgi:hypothetical protein
MDWKAQGWKYMQADNVITLWALLCEFAAVVVGTADVEIAKYVPSYHKLKCVVTEQKVGVQVIQAVQ